jgi:SAM-dependent methyltransferase
MSATRPSRDVAAEYTAEFILSALPADATKVLEIGCGRGEVACLLRQAGLDVVAIDVDEAAIAAARSLGVEARLALWPDVEAATVDAIIFTRSLHHMQRLDESLAAAFATVGPGGRVIVEDFDFLATTKASETWVTAMGNILESAAPATIGNQRPAPRQVPEGEHPNIHSAAALELALASAASILRKMPSAYLFRYLEPVTGRNSPLLALALQHELELIRHDVLPALGRRYVAIRSGERLIYPGTSTKRQISKSGREDAVTQRQHSLGNGGSVTTPEILDC